MITASLQEKNVVYDGLLTIYLACHNRTAFLRDAIESLISQSDCEFRIIISDNSSNDKVNEFVKINYPRLEYVRRFPFLSGDAHGNTIFKECNTEFVMVMHDDDCLHTDFVKEVKVEIANNRYFDIFATNGQFISENGITLKRQFFYSRKSRVQIRNQEELIGRWFSYGTLGVAPFPSYIYRVSAIKTCEINISKYGQYGDFWFIMNLLRCGSNISWINKRLYFYRVHDKQDSSLISFKTYSRLKINTKKLCLSHYLTSNFTLVRLGHLLTFCNFRPSHKIVRKRLLKIKLIQFLMHPLLCVKRIYSTFLLTNF